MRKRAMRSTVVAGLITAVFVLGSPQVGRPATTIKAYARGMNGFQIVPLLSVNDRVPLLSDPARSYRMVGVPDGLGLRTSAAGTLLYMSHELHSTDVSQPIVHGPRFRGAYVSEWLLNDQGDPVGGGPAFKRTFQDTTLVGPIATTRNDAPAFGRFCSGTMAGRNVGFTQPIYLANEEEDGGDSFDGRGGQTVAVYHHEAHALSRLGHFSKENSVVWPNDGRKTVIISLEDGPTSADSQLYMYVGTKNPATSGVLALNGLVNGQLYVFASSTSGKNDEASFTAGAIQGRWVRIPNAGSMSGGQLETAADQLGAFGFVQIEDGAFSKTNRTDFFFVTTGDSALDGNALGRLYHLKLNRSGVLQPPGLEIVYNADSIVAARGDVAINPDNVETSRRHLMVVEDAKDSGVLHDHGRDGGIWRFELRDGDLRTNVLRWTKTFVAEVTPPGRDGVDVGVGDWEASGVLDASKWFGPGTWLFDVQAGDPTSAPAPGTVEDGQLLLLRG
jgi:uncharacterized protein DUF839